MLAAVTAVGVLCAPAAAQSGTFVLDGSGGDGWTESYTPEPGSDEAVIAQVRRLLAEGRASRARGLADRWIQQHKRSANPYLAEAYVLRGEAQLRSGREYKALFDLEIVVRDFPGSDAFVRANELELEIGLMYLGGLRRKLFGIRFEDARPVGEELLVRVQERMPGSRLAERAAIELADYYYRRRELDLAADMYAIFIHNFPESAYRERAALRQIYCNVAKFKGPAYDASSLQEAKILIEDFRADYPADAERLGITEGLLNRIDESSARQSLETALWYLRRGDEPAGRLVLRRLLRRHPASSAAAQGLEIMIERGWVEVDEPVEDAPPTARDDAADDAGEGETP